MSEKKLSNLIGSVLFIIALITYVLTLEPTTSFWDCSEFISCAYKLEIGHAPGAPMFMLLGRLFSMFAFGDVTKVAFMINLLSATASALTIMFLFWTICWFAKKLLSFNSNEPNETTRRLIIYGSSAIGALAYAFSDSFWFSAVEGEVYATSSLFSAIVFWAILKWEEAESGWQSTRWIILIFYLLGLSVGIHLLNTLILTAMALIFYYKNYKASTKGVLLAIIISSAVIVFFIFGLIPGVATLAAYFDLIFVNSFDLPVYSGAIAFVIILSIGIYFAYKRTLSHKIKWLNTAVLALSFWLIGYSSFTLLVIRSNADPFVDMNNVENVFGLVNYLNREQYPKRPLFYGNNYNSPIVDVKNRYTYKLYDGKYFEDELNPEYIYDDQTLTLFPRMASNDPGHAAAYQSWVNVKGRMVEIKKQDGGTEQIKVPTFGDNLSFFFKYQLGYMYFRYFMWNFSGRQNDMQGHGGILHGNWITGIGFIDKQLTGSEVDPTLTANSLKSRNVYYMLPLLLGIIGFIFQYRKDPKNLMVNLLFFVYTGIAIVVYLNEIPSTPRERDYVYVGSFYAFAIWIGLGSAALMNQIKMIGKNKIAIYLTFIALLILVPINMLYENFDDHDRSNRYTARDYAENLLQSCEKNAILFTNADNDTYPVWYIQEVEGVRTDIREVLEPFIAMDWYANQLPQKLNEREGISLSFNDTDLLMSKNRYFPIINKIDSAIDLKEAIEFIRSDDERTKVMAQDNSVLDYLPGNKLTLKVNRENFLASCSYCQIDTKEIPEKIEFEIKSRYLTRDDLLILDMLKNTDWKRPFYFNNPGSLESIGLGQYLHREGAVYRLLPFKNELPGDIMHQQALYQYNAIKNKFKWGNVNLPNVYLDHMNVQMVSMMQFSDMFADVAQQLIKTGEKEKALELLELNNSLFPADRIPYTYTIPGIVKTYYMAGSTEKANDMARKIGQNMAMELAYYQSVNKKMKSPRSMVSEVQKNLYILNELVDICENYAPDLQKELSETLEKYYPMLEK